MGRIEQLQEPRQGVGERVGVAELVALCLAQRVQGSAARPGEETRPFETSGKASSIFCEVPRATRGRNEPPRRAQRHCLGGRL